MERVLEILSQYQWWIYGVLGLILLFYLRRALLARRDGARSLFKLEQEQARVRYGRSVTISAVILLIMVTIFVVSNPLAGSPPPTAEPTPTETTGPLTASTLTPTPPPATITPTPTPTQTLPPRPVRPSATPEVVSTETPEVRPPLCANPNARITSPGINQVVRGSFPVRGTANIPGFQYYKIEVGPGANPGESDWTVIGQLHESPVTGGILETFNAGAYPDGTWTLRLVVVDQTGNYPEPCRVRVIVQR